MELIDLTKILKIGDEVYYIISGQYTVVTEIKAATYPIVCKAVTVTKDGRLYNNYDNGECVIFPSKTERDWSKYIQEKERLNRIEDAKQKYPVGTKLHPAHLITNASTGIVQQVKSHEIKEYFSPYCLCFEGTTTNWLTCVYHEKKGWAEIVKEPLFTTEDGVDVFGEELVWFIHIKDNYTMGPLRAKELEPSAHPAFRYFSSKESAGLYIAKNKSTFTTEQREEIIRLINMYK